MNSSCDPMNLSIVNSSGHAIVQDSPTGMLSQIVCKAPPNMTSMFSKQNPLHLFLLFFPLFLRLSPLLLSILLSSPSPLFTCLSSLLLSILLSSPSPLFTISLSSGISMEPSRPVVSLLRFALELSLSLKDGAPDGATRWRRRSCLPPRKGENFGL